MSAAFFKRLFCWHHWNHRARFSLVDGSRGFDVFACEYCGTEKLIPFRAPQPAEQPTSPVTDTCGSALGRTE